MVTSLIASGLKAKGRGAQNALAEHLDVRPQTVSKWVKGETTPDMDKWKRIEEFLGLPKGALWRAAGLVPIDELLPDRSSAPTWTQFSRTDTVSQILSRLEDHERRLNLLEEHVDTRDWRGRAAAVGGTAAPSQPPEGRATHPGGAQPEAGD